MSAPRLWTTLLLVLGSVLLGALLTEAVRMAGGRDQDTIAPNAAERVARLEAEVERLRTALASKAVPAEAGRLSGRGRWTANGRQADGRRRQEAAANVLQPDLPGNVDTPAAHPVVVPHAPGVLDVIRRLDAQDVRQADARLVGASFATGFEATAQGPTLRADELEPDAELEDGTVIVLDEGVHDFSAFANAHRGTFPADLTFRGIGRDRTLLILHEIAATGEMRNLAFEDLTLDTRGHYLADVRGDEPISIRFDRARVIGFDAGPGGAVLLAARHGAVLARDSDFEAGFGDAPGTGSFFHVRGPFLVRFERCLLRGPFKSLYEKSDKAAYAYTACRFERMHPDRRRDLEATDPNVRFEDCLIDYALDSEGALERRAVTELNADWE